MIIIIMMIIIIIMMMMMMKTINRVIIMMVTNSNYNYISFSINTNDNRNDNNTVFGRTILLPATRGCPTPLMSLKRKTASLILFSASIALPALRYNPAKQNST